MLVLFSCGLESTLGPLRHFAMTKKFGRYQGHNRHWGPADSFISVENDFSAT
jgi:hypothetical protein